MPIDLAPMPLRVRAVALPGGEAAADDLRRALSDPVVEGLRIDHQRLGGPWDSEADRGLTEGLVDLVLLVTEPHDDGGHAAFLADAVAVLSADATIGAVGRPHTATAPAHPLAPAAGDLLVRADALRLVGGLGDAPPEPGTTSTSAHGCGRPASASPPPGCRPTRPSAPGPPSSSDG